MIKHIINLTIFIGYTLYLIFSTGFSKIITNLYDYLQLSDLISPTGPDSKSDYLYTELITGIYIPPLIALGFVVLHIIYLALIPKIYVHLALFLGPTIVVLLCIAIMIYTKRWLQICADIVMGLVILIVLCCYCCFKNLINFTAQVMKFTARNLLKHPGVFLLPILQTALDIVIWIFFVLGVFLLPLKGWENYYYAIYIYYLFAMYWIQNTLHLVFFSINANLSACIFFLDGTEYQMKFLLFHAIKKCFLTLGSSAFAGLIATFLDFLERIAKKTIKKLPCRGCCCCC